MKNTITEMLIRYYSMLVFSNICPSYAKEWYGDIDNYQNICKTALENSISNSKTGKIIDNYCNWSVEYINHCNYRFCYIFTENNTNHHDCLDVVITRKTIDKEITCVRFHYALSVNDNYFNDLLDDICLYFETYTNDFESWNR